MQGGKRKNAGRKPIAEKKKSGYKVYISDNQKYEIEEYGAGLSFSEKCVNLIQEEINRIKLSTNNSVRFIDLFAGLGGMRLGFESGLRQLGYDSECVFSSEIKDYAIKAYKNYFRDNRVFGDITQIKSECIPAFDFLLAGFPCQPFSSAGKGLGFEDTRGTLFFEIERILREKKPYGFLLENVEGLVNHDKGSTLKIILDHLSRLGYVVNHKILDSKEFGLAQSRKRVYIVGTKMDEVNLENFQHRSSTLGEILEHGLPVINSKFTKCLFANYTSTEVVGKSIKDKRGGSENIHSWEIDYKGKTSDQERALLNRILLERRRKKWATEIGIDWMDGMPLTFAQIKSFYDIPNLQECLNHLVKLGYLTYEFPKKLVKNKRIIDDTKDKGYNIVAGKLSFEFSKILDPSQLAPTLVAMDVSKLGIIDGNGLRKLTIREGLRLCGFPEDYDLACLKETEAFDLLGNTVCVPVIEAISARIASTMRSKERMHIDASEDYMVSATEKRASLFV